MGWRRRNRVPTKFGGAIGIIFGLIFILGGVVLTFVFWSDQARLEDMRDNGKPFSGEVIHNRHTTSKSGRNTTHHYYITVRYDHAGRFVQKEIEIEEDAWGRYKTANAAAPQTCTVLAASPDDFVVKEAVDEMISDKSNTKWIFLTAGVGFGLLSLWGGINTFKRASEMQVNPYPPGYAPYPAAPPYTPYGQSGYPPQPRAYQPPPSPPMR